MPTGTLIKMGYAKKLMAYADLGIRRLVLVRNAMVAIRYRNQLVLLIMGLLLLLYYPQ